MSSGLIWGLHIILKTLWWLCLIGSLQSLSCVSFSVTHVLFATTHTRISCPSPSPGACWNMGPFSQWCQSNFKSVLEVNINCILLMVTFKIEKYSSGTVPDTRKQVSEDFSSLENPKHMKRLIKIVFPPKRTSTLSLLTRRQDCG